MTEETTITTNTKRGARMTRIMDERDEVSRPSLSNESGRASATSKTPTLQANGERLKAKTHMNLSWDPRISIAVDPVALITTECITVTSAMRKHARWAHSSVSAILGGGPSVAAGRDFSRLTRSGDKNSAAGQSRLGRSLNVTLGEDDTLSSRWGLRGKRGKSMQDNPLLSAFARLRNDLRGCTGRSNDTLLPSVDAHPL